jgi:hypothetical protein
MSGNYTSNIAINGAQLPDLLNGGWLSASPDAIVWHNQVLGDVWHVVEFHFKLNSAPGVRDGIFQHWLDGQKLVDMRGMPWIGTSGSMDAKWNSFSIGGNDHFQFNMTGPLSDRERWYAIDDIAVHSTAPLDRQ